METSAAVCPSPRSSGWPPAAGFLSGCGRLHLPSSLEGDAGFFAGLAESLLNRRACPTMVLIDDANELAVLLDTGPQSGVERQRSDRHLTSDVCLSIAFGR